MRRPHTRPFALAQMLLPMVLCALVLAGCASARDSGSVSPPPPLARSVAATASAATAPAFVASASAPASATASASASAPPAPPRRKPRSASAHATARRNPRLYPNPRLTPGAVFPVTAAQVSVSGYSSRVRNVPVSEKHDVYAEYHLAYPQARGAYECDHFIPLCLGGSNSIKNLWPEPAPEFHWKDGFEVYLWRQVRARRMSLREAQREMRTDWYSYWVKAGKP